MPIVINSWITPEYYQLMPDIHNDSVKALFVSCDKKSFPTIISDSPEKIHKSLFIKEKPYCLFFARGFHMYVSPLETYVSKYPNHIATTMVRQYGLHSEKEIVYGNVVLFGSFNLMTMEMDNKDHSVPYDIIEESWRIYDAKKY